MLKLVHYIANKDKKEKKKKEMATASAAAEEALQLTRQEKQEIRMTLNKMKGSEIHAILMKQLELHQLEELKTNLIVDDPEPEPEPEEDSGDEPYSSGTFCVKDLRSAPAPAVEEEEQNFGTFCVKTTKSSSALPPSSSSSSAPDDSDPKKKGSRREKKGGSGPELGHTAQSTSALGQTSSTSSSSSSSPKMSSASSSPAIVAKSSSGVSAMYREPEDWEKCILALERGEWTDEMTHNKDAFKRWKKERPAMPSAYYKSPPPVAGPGHR